MVIRWNTVSFDLRPTKIKIVHLGRLIRIFTEHVLDSQSFFMQTTQTDQTVWMHKLI